MESYSYNLGPLRFAEDARFDTMLAKTTTFFAGFPSEGQPAIQVANVRELARRACSYGSEFYAPAVQVPGRSALPAFCAAIDDVSARISEVWDDPVARAELVEAYGDVPLGQLAVIESLRTMDLTDGDAVGDALLGPCA